MNENQNEFENNEFQDDELENMVSCNGVDGSTGGYTLPQMSVEELSDLILGKPKNETDHDKLLKAIADGVGFVPMGPKQGVDAKNLAEAGWGIIFPYGMDPAIKEALSELINWRREQAGDYFCIYEESDAIRPNETKMEFLARHKVGPGPADPEKMPYYLLLVGSPEEISYTFQYQLDVQYAVGRIHFNTPKEYANYARSVVKAEKEPLKLSRDVAFFSTANQNDRATQMSTQHMMEPLSQKLQTEFSDWNFATHMAENATKTQLSKLLGGNEMPALLFTSSHGIGFPLGDYFQLPHQGSIICQEWPGPRGWAGAMPHDFYFAGDDLPKENSLSGLICFSFACYSAGTPRYDDFSGLAAGSQRKQIAEKPFIAQLPMRMLSHESGGAQAFIGHVDRAWGHSFMWPGAGVQTVAMESMLSALLDGSPVGHAVEYINEKHAEIATMLNDLLKDIEFGKQHSPQQLAGLWTGCHDARNYAIIGDPAVRLRVAAPNEQPSATRNAFSLEQPHHTSPIGPTQTEPKEADSTIDLNAFDDFFSEIAMGLRTIKVSTYKTDGPNAEDRILKLKTTIVVGGEFENDVMDEIAEGDEHIILVHDRSVRQAVDARLAYLRMIMEETSKAD